MEHRVAPQSEPQLSNTVIDDHHTRVEYIMETRQRLLRCACMWWWWIQYVPKLDSLFCISCTYLGSWKSVLISDTCRHTWATDCTNLIRGKRAESA